MPRQARLIAFWALVGLLGLFIVFNFHQVPINFWFILEVRVPAAFLIFLSAGMGASAVLLLQFLREHRRAAPPPAP